jgi:hypothetical protein
MHYEVEVRTNAGEWLGINKRYKLLGDASLRAAQGEDRGCITRVVRVAGDGAREVVEARACARVAAQARLGGGADPRRGLPGGAPRR